MSNFDSLLMILNGPNRKLFQKFVLEYFQGEENSQLKLTLKQLDALQNELKVMFFNGKLPSIGFQAMDQNQVKVSTIVQNILEIVEKIEVTSVDSAVLIEQLLLNPNVYPKVDLGRHTLFGQFMMLKPHEAEAYDINLSVLNGYFAQADFIRSKLRYLYFYNARAAWRSEFSSSNLRYSYLAYLSQSEFEQMKRPKAVKKQARCFAAFSELRRGAGAGAAASGSRLEAVSGQFAAGNLFNFPELLEENDVHILLKTNVVGARRARLVVSRGHLINDFFSFVTQNRPQARLEDAADEICAHMSLEFEHEMGIDGGGLTREFYYQLIAENQRMSWNLLKFAPDSQLHWFAYQGPGFLLDDYYKKAKLLGVAVGLGVLKNIQFGQLFPKFLYDRLLDADQTTAQEKYQEVFPVKYENLLKLKDLSAEEIDSLDLYFTEDYFSFDEPMSAETVPDGEKLRVTASNVDEYIESVAVFHFASDRVQQLIANFVDGFKIVIPQYKLNFLTTRTLLQIINPRIDFAQLRQITRYDNYEVTSVTIVDFWEVINSYSEDEKQLFLKFVFGQPRPEAFGFKKFCICRNASEGYPVSHTCSNQLDLPDYKDRAILATRLMFCLKNSSGFGVE